jgi:hypothetical protein
VAGGAWTRAEAVPLELVPLELVQLVESVEVVGAAGAADAAAPGAGSVVAVLAPFHSAPVVSGSLEAQSDGCLLRAVEHFSTAALRSVKADSADFLRLAAEKRSDVGHWAAAYSAVVRWRWAEAPLALRLGPAMDSAWRRW